MASLVILVVALIHISFENAKIIVTKKFVAFIDRNLGIVFPRHGKLLVLPLSRSSPLNNITFASPPPLTSQTRYLLLAHLLLNTT